MKQESIKEMFEDQDYSFIPKDKLEFFKNVKKHVKEDLLDKDSGNWDILSHRNGVQESCF